MSKAVGAATTTVYPSGQSDTAWEMTMMHMRVRALIPTEPKGFALLPETCRLRSMAPGARRASAAGIMPGRGRLAVPRA